MPTLSGFEPVAIRGPRPVPLLGPFGNLLRFFGDPVRAMLSLHRAYGEIAALADNNPGMVLAFGPELNRAVLTNPRVFEHSSEIPVQAPPGSALSRFNQVLPFLNGEVHQRRRRLMMPAFHKAATDAYAPDIVSVADAVLAHWPTGRTVDASQLLRRLTAAVALRCLFGLDALGGSEVLGELEAGLLEALSSPLTIAAPFMLPGLPFRRAVRLSDAVEARLREVIAERREQLSDGRERHDVLSILLRAPDADALTDAELLGECNGLFVAGYDTAAQTLTWTLFLLAQHPDVTSALVEEVDAVLHGAPPRAEDVPRLSLTDRVLDESMRLLPAAPMLFIRVTADEAALGPHVLPRGASVVLSPLVTHRDPDRFPEPTRFRPSRWEDLSPSPYEFLPFGAGSRMCLGSGFAALALRLLLPMIVQRFRFALPDGARVDQSVRGIAMAPKKGLPLVLERQDGSIGRRAAISGNLLELVEW